MLRTARVSISEQTPFQHFSQLKFTRRHFYHSNTQSRLQTRFETVVELENTKAEKLDVCIVNNESEQVRD